MVNRPIFPTQPSPKRRPPEAADAGAIGVTAVTAVRDCLVSAVNGVKDVLATALPTGARE